MIPVMRPGPGHWEKLGEIETERQKGREERERGLRESCKSL